MQLITEVEVSYFRSFYKFKINNTNSLNVVFGKNDSGKSNLVRALNLFFNGSPDLNNPFDFPVDFCERRLVESEEAEDVRKFLYVKITFRTPSNFRKSLGKSFYVKRQWTISRGNDYHEEISSSIPGNRRHIATRFLNKIRFIYIPAIKDIHIFEMLLSRIYETLGESEAFEKAIDNFSRELQGQTGDLFSNLPKEISGTTKIGAPTQLRQLFQTLDFETTIEGERSSKSLTRQRGDGVKVRHIPELLTFISQNDSFDFHIWGFEEPENSLDFSASQAEAQRFLEISDSDKIQIFLTTHSPSFYLLESDTVARFYVSKQANGDSTAIQGRDLEKFDPQTAIGEGFYLPAVSEALKDLAAKEIEIKNAETRVSELKAELADLQRPIVLTEGPTDAAILRTAWKKLRKTEMPFEVRSCETERESSGGGNGGAHSLAARLKGVASDHPFAVIGLFDNDNEGKKAYQLDRNFSERTINGHSVKGGGSGKAYAALLPAPSFRNDCLTYANLPIEFMFRDEYLERKSADGKKLILKTKKATTMLGDIKVEKDLDDITHFKDIKGGKKEFAYHIVPNFGAEAFDGFEAVFNVLEAIIGDSKRSLNNQVK